MSVWSQGSKTGNNLQHNMLHRSRGACGTTKHGKATETEPWAPHLEPLALNIKKGFVLGLLTNFEPKNSPYKKGNKP